MNAKYCCFAGIQYNVGHFFVIRSLGFSEKNLVFHMHSVQVGQFL